MEAAGPEDEMLASKGKELNVVGEQRKPEKTGAKDVIPVIATFGAPGQEVEIEAREGKFPMVLSEGQVVQLR